MARSNVRNDNRSGKSKVRTVKGPEWICGARKVRWICGVEYHEMAAPPEKQLQQLMFAGYQEKTATGFITLCFAETTSSPPYDVV